MSNSNDYAVLEDSSHPPFSVLPPIESDDDLLATSSSFPTLRAALVLRHPEEVEEELKDEKELFINPIENEPLNLDTYASSFSANPDDINTVTQAVQAAGMEVDEVVAMLGIIYIKGNKQQMEQFFNIQLLQYLIDDVETVGFEGPVYLPKSLAGIVVSVIGINTMRIKRDMAASNSITPKEINGVQGWSGADFARFYNYPSEYDGSGQTIGIINLEGGYKDDEMDTYFSAIGISPTPTIVAVSADGTENSPGVAYNDLEVNMDVQVAGAAAPGAKIVVYFAENTELGFFRAVQRAVLDMENNPKIISISWGKSESDCSTNYINSFNLLFQIAANLGISVFCSAGNYGASNYNPTTTNTGLNELSFNIQFPASSPFITCCGGTTMKIENGEKVDEVAWNADYNYVDPWNGATFQSHLASGGGFSDKFPSLPLVRVLAGEGDEKWMPNKRGIPDVAAHANPAENGYLMYTNGEYLISGGTSASTPMWAALTARLQQAIGEHFFATPVLYVLAIYQHQVDAKNKYANTSFEKILKGNNAIPNSLGTMGYEAKNAWNPCSGLGVPNGQLLLDALKAAENKDDQFMDFLALVEEKQPELLKLR